MEIGFDLYDNLPKDKLLSLLKSHLKTKADKMVFKIKDKYFPKGEDFNIN